MNCKFCYKEMNISHRAYNANPFCGSCLPKRLEAAGAIDLKNNSRIIELDNGYNRIEPIDPTKLFKA